MSVLIVDHEGTVRFKPNRIVRDLLTAAQNGSTLTLNDIGAKVGLGYTLDEHQEFYQLIGYSVDGYQDIFYADKLHVVRP